tara:strand:- start:631 stop:834 length:204 start_codon:yes stop_codon:yes gene_type:complete
MVVSHVATVEVSSVAGAGELLSVGGFPKGADGISDSFKARSGYQMQLQTVELKQQAVSSVGFSPASR